MCGNCWQLTSAGWLLVRVDHGSYSEDSPKASLGRSSWYASWLELGTLQHQNKYTDGWSHQLTIRILQSSYSAPCGNGQSNAYDVYSLDMVALHAFAWSGGRHTLCRRLQTPVRPD